VIAATELEGMGLSFTSTGGKLAVGGLKRLSPEQREFALTLAKENKAAILEELQRREELDYAFSLLVDCPARLRHLHCWYCSRCGQARRCAAWRPHRPDVEFFKRSKEPASLTLLETLEAEEVLQ
jgi:hypothetical protein